jgi:hypothetical protein
VAEKGNGTVVAAIIAATAAVLTTVIAQPYTQKRWIEPLTCDRKFEFTAPTNGQRIQGQGGVVVIGKTCGYDKDTDHAWIFELDPEDDPTYYSVSDQAISGREWALFDGPIGDEGDGKKKYTLVVFNADQSCNQILVDMIAKGKGETSFKQPPDGCKAEDTRDIIVTYPKDKG